MDQDYRNNIAGSPYLEEGVGARLKSRAANAISAGQAPMGQQLDNPQQAKLRSLWDGFIANLKRLLADVEQNIDPLIQNRQANQVDPETGKVSSPVTDEQKEMLDSLKDLYRMIEPSGLARVQAPRHQDDPTMLNKKTDVFGGKLNTSKLKELMSESAWDALKRGFSKGGVGLTKALVSRDPNKILNAYKKAINDLFNTFIQDAAKVTGYPKDMISKVVKSIYPPNKYRDVLNKIEQVKGLPDVGVPPVQQPQEPTAPSASAATAQPTPQPEPPQAAQPEPIQQPTTTQPEQPQATQAASGPVSVGDLSYITDERDMGLIIERTIAIIVDAVSQDTKHAKSFLGPTQEPLPSTFYEPPLTTKEGEEPEKKKKMKSDKPNVEVPDQFLYNFFGKYDKAKHFAIEVTPVNKDLLKPFNLPYSTKKSGTPINVEIEVWWDNQALKNDIRVKIKHIEKNQIAEILLMSFYDHEVSTEMGAGKSGGQRQFKIGSALRKADPKNEEWLNNTDNNIRARIIGQSDNLLRAFYATTFRKAMEWKPKTSAIKSYTIGPEGSAIETTSKKGEEDITKNLSKAEIINLLQNAPDKEELAKSLKHAGYFKVNQDVEQYCSKTVPQVFTDFVNFLVNKGVDPKAANSRASLAWDKLEKLGKKPNHNDLLSVVNGTYPYDYPEFTGAVGVLSSMGKGKTKESPDVAEKLVLGAWDALLKQGKNAKDITAKDLVAMAKKQPEPLATAAAPTTTVSTTAAATDPAASTPPSAPAAPPTEPETPEEPELATPKKGQTPDEQLAKLNGQLQALGIDALENVQQMARLFSLKGAWNTKVQNKAQVEDNEDLLALKLGKSPNETQKRLWVRLVANAKKGAQPKKQKKAPEAPQEPQQPTNERINPFQRSNFLLD